MIIKHFLFTYDSFIILSDVIPTARFAIYESYKLSISLWVQQQFREIWNSLNLIYLSLIFDP